MKLITKDKSRLFVYLTSLIVFVILVCLGFLYPYWESYKRAHPKPMRYEAREDAVPELDIHPKFRVDDFYEGKLSYKKPSIINQLSPSSTIFIHSISWDTTTSGFIHTVGTMCYTPIKGRAERVHKTGIIFSSSGKSTMVSIGGRYRALEPKTDEQLEQEGYSRVSESEALNILASWTEEESE